MVLTKLPKDPEPGKVYQLKMKNGQVRNFQATGKKFPKFKIVKG